MANAKFSGLTGADGTAVCSRDAVFAACLEPKRRKLLYALAAGGEQNAFDLLYYGKQRVRTDSHRLDSTFKHLASMLKSGVLVQKPNPQDGRRPLYAFPPGTKVSVTSSMAEIDYGSCVIRLSANQD